MVVITLKSLPASFENFIKTLNITSVDVDPNSKDLGTMLSQQDRWKMKFRSSSRNEGLETALASNYKGKGKFTKKIEGSRIDDSSNHKTFKCQYSGKTNHRKKFYRKWKYDE